MADHVHRPLSETERCMLAIRESLTNVSGYAQFLRRQLATPRVSRTRLADYAAGLEDETQRLQRRIAQLEAALEGRVDDRLLATGFAARRTDD